jgi:hypothetical protein
MPIVIPAHGLSRWLPAGWVRNAAFTLAGVAVLVMGGVVLVWFASSLTVDERIAAITAVLAVGALLLAVLATIVAIAGYRFTQRRPRLGIGLFISDPLPSSDPTSTVVTITPQMSNVGSASATSARVTFTLFGADVIASNQWQLLSSTIIACDVPVVHVDPTIPLVLPNVTVRYASDNHEARLSWRAVADLTRDSGSYLLNI